jgi:hypothetical protein
MRKPLFLVVFIALSSLAAADTLRGPVVSHLLVSSDPDDYAESVVQPTDLLTIELSGEVDLIQAVEIEFRPVRRVAGGDGALVLRVIDTRSSTAERGVAEYTGRMLVEDPIVGSGRRFIQIPLDATTSIPASAGTVVSEPRIASPEPIVVSVQPVMKGLPDAALQNEYSVTVRSIVKDLGVAQVHLQGPDGRTVTPEDSAIARVSLYVDGELVTPHEDLYLAPGLHHASLASAGYEDQELSFAVERGRRATITLPLVLAQATVTFEAPRGSIVYIDGTRMPRERGDFTLAPGEHTMTVAVGDFTVTRRFVVEARRAYVVSVSLDILVTEAK